MLRAFSLTSNGKMARPLFHFSVIHWRRSISSSGHAAFLPRFARFEWGIFSKFSLLLRQRRALLSDTLNSVFVCLYFHLAFSVWRTHLPLAFGIFDPVSKCFPLSLSRSAADWPGTDNTGQMVQASSNGWTNSWARSGLRRFLVIGPLNFMIWHMLTMLRSSSLQNAFINWLYEVRSSGFLSMSSSTELPWNVESANTSLLSFHLMTVKFPCFMKEDSPFL